MKLKLCFEEMFFNQIQWNQWGFLIQKRERTTIKFFFFFRGHI